MAALATVVPSDAEFEAYYAKLTAATPFPVAVRPTRHGKGLVVTAPVRAGAVILVDAPFAACQARGSRALALACAACGAYLSSPGGQLAHGLLSSGVDDGDDGEGDGAQTLLRLVAGAADAAAGPRLAGGRALPPPRPCAGGCSDELYCSDACARADWETGHALLCGGADPDSPLAAAVADLRDYADATNDALLLAARAAARVAAAAGGDPAALPRAWLPLAVAEKAAWWDVPAWPPAEGAGGGTEAGLRRSIRELARGCAARLRAVLAATAPRVADALACDSVVGALVGAFELNNLEIDVPPLADALDTSTPPTPEYAALLARAGGPAALAAIRFRGSAFYPLHSTANHACAPSARALPGAGTGGLPPDARGPAAPAGAAPVSCVLVAARDLAPGDEVTLCYVDEGASLDARAAALRDYGIAPCDCGRCAAERGAAAAPRPRRGGVRGSSADSSASERGGGGGRRPAKRRRRGTAWLGAWRVE